jgi:hypothetical protein
MIKILQNLAVVCAKTPTFCQIFLRKYFKNHKIGPRTIFHLSMKVALGADKFESIFFCRKTIRAPSAPCLETRVTRLGKFSPTYWVIVYFGQFC